MRAIRSGALNVCGSGEFVYTWESYDGGQEIYIANAVGDFSKVYSAIYEFARKHRFLRISANSMRGKAFVRRLRALGYKPTITYLGDGLSYIQVRVNHEQRRK